MLVLVVMASLLFSPRAGHYRRHHCTLPPALSAWLILTGSFHLASTGIPTGSLSDWLNATLTIFWWGW